MKSPRCARKTEPGLDSLPGVTGGPGLGVGGYVAAITVTTLGYALFQTADNTAAMADVPGHRRGVVAGLLNLSRNLGLLTGASALGAVLAAAVSTNDISLASPAAIAAGLRPPFAVALALVILAAAIALITPAPEPLKHPPLEA